MVKNAYYLSWRYLQSAPWRTTVLVFCIAVAFALPSITFFSSSMIGNALRARGTQTPILIGKKGNEFDLTMSSLYFRSSVRDKLNMQELESVSVLHSGLTVPLYVNHTASQTPIVGTSVEYFTARNMQIDQGREFALLGEVVAGSSVAEEFNLQIGDTIRSDLQNLYNIAGAYPMTLQVVGIASHTGTPDDQCFLADTKTIWALDGILHGHEKVTKDNSLNGQNSAENLEATAAIFMFAELTEQNRSEFHMHGEAKELPLSAVAVFPKSQEEHDIILGEFALSEMLQAVRPVEIVDSILDIVLRVQQGLWVYFSTVLLSTIAFVGITLVLSLQLRAEELRLIKRIGGSASTIRSMVIAELSIVVGAALCVTAMVTTMALGVLQWWLGM